MSTAAAGYSGTPLVKKLGIKPGWRIFASRAPQGYEKLICPLPEGASISSRLTPDTDLMHLFATTRKDLEAAVKKSLKTMKPEAVIWISWPKKASKVSTDITENIIREIVLPLGLVDIKVCAIDEVWSGLKLMLRKELRPLKK